jgi:hypothetical protein
MESRVKVAKKVLGLAIGQKSILVAEVTMRGDRPVVGNVGEFVFPEGVLLSAPAKMGEALAQFLKEKHLTAKEVVFGLPAKRLVTRQKEVPAAPLELAASTLRLQAEGEFSSELDNLVMDFAGTPSVTKPTTVLLIATNKVMVDECVEIGRVAGLKVLGVTSTGAALGRASSKMPKTGSLVLSLGTTGAELVVQHGVDTTQLKHLNVMGTGDDAIAALAGEIRRNMALIPTNGSPVEMTLWGSGTGDGPRRILEQRLNMPVSTAELRGLAAAESPGMDAFAPAVALALVAMDASGLPVDFTNSRLAAPKEPAISLQKKMGIAAAVVAIILIGGGFYYMATLSSDLSAIKASNAQRASRVTEAKAMQKRYKDAVDWIPKGPKFVNVDLALTQIFPPQANTVWVTNLASNTDGWELAGQAMSQELVKNLVDAMLNDPRFSQPVNTYLAQDQSSRVFTFKIKFTFNNVESK